MEARVHYGRADLERDERNVPRPRFVRRIGLPDMLDGRQHPDAADGEVVTAARVSDRTSTTPRRRTQCVYCGRRIPGAFPSNSQERRFAARLTCSRHWRLVLSDPEFEYAVERL